MKNNIQKIAIESLFEKDTELAFWQLRERANEANIETPALWELLKEANEAGYIGFYPNNIIKFYGDYQRIYISEITAGVKCANKLCEAVLTDMKHIRSGFNSPSVKTLTEEMEKYISGTLDAGDWKAELNHSIETNAQLFPKCGKPHVTRWHNHKGTQYLNCYASERAYVNGAAFLTISVTEKEY
jgi:hypothetical protein